MQRFGMYSVYCIFIALLCVSFPSFALTQQQQAYQQAKKALESSQMRQYQQLRQQLTGYPLTIYLDYQQLSRNFAKTPHNEIADYLNQYGNTPPGVRLRTQYLHYLAKSQQWQRFMTFANREPKSTALKCSYYSALYHTGEKQRAFIGAEKIWLNGRSLPKQCDPLFKQLKQHNRLNDDLIWQRMQLAFKARKGSLIKYLSRSLSPHLKPWGSRLLDVYHHPRKLRQHKRFSADSPINRSIVHLGLERLARIAPNQAVKQWQHYQKTLTYPAHEQLAIKQYIAYQALLRKDSKAISWVDKHIDTIARDNIVELRIRRALKAKQWQHVLRFHALLSPKQQQTDRWRYWQAHALHETGQQHAAQAHLASLATQRSFYGFLAADEQNHPYQLNEQSSSPKRPQPLSAITQQGLARITELKALAKWVAARSEWNALLRQAKPQEIDYLPTLAMEQGWWDFAITGAIKSQKWDDLELRFPAPYRAIFQQFAKMRHVDESLLLAIARRESSFYSHAASGKHAKGLMQLLPSTAKQMARKIGFRYPGNKGLFEPSVNVRLGSAYVRHLMRHYQHNRLLTAAAYNAGPTNVKKWVNDGKPLPFNIWVETLPYKETREYVQAILAYRLIYALRVQGDKHATLLTAKERKAVY